MASVLLDNPPAWAGKDYVVQFTIAEDEAGETPVDITDWVVLLDVISAGTTVTYSEGDGLTITDPLTGEIDVEILAADTATWVDGTAMFLYTTEPQALMRAAFRLKVRNTNDR